MSVLSTPSQHTGCGARQRSNHRDSRAEVARKSLTTAAFRKVVLSGLRKIIGGQITLYDADGTATYGDANADLKVRVEIHDQRFYRTIAIGGSLGAGEAYRDGYWSCNDLAGLIRIFARNLKASEEIAGWYSSAIDLGRNLFHRMNRNTRSGSRRNIAAHYDLSNDFYSLFLDETMTYSSGIFASPESSMREASVEKYDRICRKLQLCPADNVLEIGTGWGGFAVHAVKNYGCRLTTTTISKQQHDYARQRFRDEGISDRVQLQLTDYRDLSGEYDKLVSIEMIEAVGHEYFDTYFAKCSSLLKNDGLFALQAITIPDQRYDRYRKSVDFIQRYIFPGGCLPSISAMTGSLARVTDLRLAHFEDFAEHYARTLRCWRERFFDNLDEIRELGMTESFLRLWEYYFCYCEGAFAENQIGVSQLVLQKPQAKHGVPFPTAICWSQS